MCCVLFKEYPLPLADVPSVWHSEYLQARGLCHCVPKPSFDSKKICLVLSLFLRTENPASISQKFWLIVATCSFLLTSRPVYLVHQIQLDSRSQHCVIDILENSTWTFSFLTVAEYRFYVHIVGKSIWTDMYRINCKKKSNLVHDLMFYVGRSIFGSSGPRTEFQDRFCASIDLVRRMPKTSIRKLHTCHVLHN